jgi:predicted ATPase
MLVTPQADRLHYASDSVATEAIARLTELTAADPRTGRMQARDPLIEQWFHRRRALRLEVWNEQLNDRLLGHQLHRSVVYNEGLLAGGLYDFSGLATERDSGELILMAGYDRRGRSRRDPGDESALLGLLLPAFRAGHHALTTFGARQAALAATLDAVGDALLLAGPDGRVLHQNAALVRVLAADPGRDRVLATMVAMARELGGRRGRAIWSEAAAGVAAPAADVVTPIARYALRATFADARLWGIDGAVTVALASTPVQAAPAPAAAPATAPPALVVSPARDTADEPRGPSVATVFGDLADLGAAERAARLALLEQHAPTLAGQVRVLLDADAGGPDFLGLREAPGGAADPPPNAGRGPADAGELAPGARVGPYRVERRLGDGGMATVWLAYDDRLGRPVALKFLRDLGRADRADRAGGARARFVVEARAAAALDHPHIAAVYDVGDAGGRPYIAMAYCAGGSLADRLAAGPLAPAEAARVGAELAEALGAAHARGVVHRDVKPANVLFDAAGAVRLADFGIAKLDGPGDGGGVATQPGLVLGTVAYLAPEQVRGERADARSDLWALGVTLYEALAGRRPFAGDSHGAVLHAVLTAAPAPLPAGVPAAVAAVVGALLAKDPADRPASADDVARALAAAAGGAAGEAAGAAAGREPRARVPAALASGVADRVPLVGRERELAAAEALVAGGARLLTLTGPGGTGKTRLALELAHRLAARHADGTVVVSLAALATADLVPGAVAQAFGVREGAGDGLDPVARYLTARELLLVLDNFEHVLDASPYVGALLAAAPRLTVLVTSRESLRLAAEQELPVPPLGLPPVVASASAVGEADAVRLFLERARAGRPDFALTDANARDVAAVCRRLDGLPLAIELAAARARLLSPRALLARLDARADGLRSDLLRSDARDAEPRHRTLRDVIDWSYALLAPDERRLFRELAVFAGGFTLDAAAAVTTAPPGAPDVLDRVASLCDKSLLVRREQPDGEPRFAMLETVREYALARLREAGEEDAARAAHAAFFVAFAEEAEPHLFAGAGNSAWVARVRDDVANLRAAARGPPRTAGAPPTGCGWARP